MILSIYFITYDKRTNIMKYILVDENEITDIKIKLDLILQNQAQNIKTQKIDKNTRETITIPEAIIIHGYSYQYWRNKVKKDKKLNNYGAGRNILLSVREIQQLLSCKTA